ncbi:hypothetical protein [Paenibacillus tritici]|uniref:hypothetical protein n=1 Tax=Paenibacillus tritici TaxID=1873425 RepID=UPI001FE93930|nr:hypothetical protein [Paenibacillus tritici]
MDGVPEAVILSRGASGSSQFGRESDYIGRFSPESSVFPGALIETEETFLVCSLRTTPDRDKYCGLVKTNMIVKVQRYSQQYDENDNPIGDEEYQTIAEGVVTFAQYVTARLRQDDPGLLPSTTYTLQLQTTVDIKDPQDAIHPDQVILHGKAYQVDAVDVVKYPNLLHVQLSDSVR